MAAHEVLKPLIVLLLEDDPNDAALIQGRLEETGYEVSLYIADTRNEFIAHLTPEIDVILSDHAMPQFDALQALELVKEAELDIPFIIVSGVIEEEMAVRAMRQGAADYLLKDRLTRLGPAIKQALREKQLRVEKERVFEAIRESEARYRLLAENATDVITRLAPDETCLYISPSSHELLGYEPDELIGKELSFLVHDDDRSIFRQSRELVDPHHPPERLTFRARRKKGTYVWIEAALNVVRDPETGEVQELVAVLRDITERQNALEALIEAKEQAEEMARLKSSFLTNMSHEIRTPLTSIIGFSDILAEECTGSIQKMALYIRGGGERLLMTLDSVLDLAQLESNSLKLWPVELDLVEEIRQLCELLTPQAQAKGLYLEMNHEAPHISATMDRGAFSRILTNLIGNALKFTRSGGVTIRARQTKDHALIDVIDTGIGIASEFIPKLFNEFNQESQGVSRDFEGIGLGLTITRRLLDIMGGAIEVASEKGTGTTVSVRLPLKIGGVGASAEGTAEIEPASPRPNVLAAEDDNVARLLLEQLLRQNYELTLVRTGEEALKLASTQRFDIVLLDINLGEGLSGEDVLAELRRRPRYAELPIVACTAYALPGDRERFIAIGFDGYLSKPFKKRQLLDVLDNALEGYSSSRRS